MPGFSTEHPLKSLPMDCESVVCRFLTAQDPALWEHARSCVVEGVPPPDLAGTPCSALVREHFRRHPYIEWGEERLKAATWYREEIEYARMQDVMLTYLRESDYPTHAIACGFSRQDYDLLGDVRWRCLPCTTDWDFVRRNYSYKTRVMHDYNTHF